MAMKELELVKHWQQLDLSKYPKVHPNDVPILQRYRPNDLKHRQLAASSFASDREAHDPYFLHLSLTPVPYVGNLSTADIFVLMLNPGFSYHEYAVESRPEVASALRANLYQDLDGVMSPFWYLDETYHKHPGHRYWSDHLRGIGTGTVGRSDLSRRMAVLQIMPYHSARFNAHKITQLLPSAQPICRYVHEVIVPKAKKGEALLIVARQVHNWGFSNSEVSPNIIIYSTGQSRGAWLTSNTYGGKRIMRWLDAGG